MLLSLSLCNGGNACHCLNESVYDFLVHGEDCKVLPTIDDIPDHESKTILLKVPVRTLHRCRALIMRLSWVVKRGSNEI